MAQAKDGIILGSDLGSSDPIYGGERDIKAEYGYTKARVDGSNSFYIFTASQSSLILTSTLPPAPSSWIAQTRRNWDSLLDPRKAGIRMESPC